jgi:hypothetical protein
VTKVAGSTNVFKILFRRGTTVEITAPDKNVSGLQADNSRISRKFEVD